MKLYIIILTIIVSNLYARNYIVSYNQFINSCEGLADYAWGHGQESFLPNKQGYVIKKILLAYHSRKSTPSKLGDFKYLALYIYYMRMHVNWSNSKIQYLNLDAETNSNDEYSIQSCQQNIRSDHSLRDHLTIRKFFSNTFRTDSFMLIAPENQELKDDHILHIVQSFDDVNSIWKQVVSKTKIIAFAYSVSNNESIIAMQKNDDFFYNVFKNSLKSEYSYPAEQRKNGFLEEQFDGNKIIEDDYGHGTLNVCALNIKSHKRDDYICLRVESNYVSGDLSRRESKFYLLNTGHNDIYNFITIEGIGMELTGFLNRNDKHQVKLFVDGEEKYVIDSRHMIVLTLTENSLRLRNPYIDMHEYDLISLLNKDNS